MIPGTGHRKVYWWGERTRLSIIDLQTLKIEQFPIAIGAPGAKLITYDVLQSQDKLLYVMEEGDDYRMVYYYDFRNLELLTAFRYTNGLCKKNPNF